MPLVLLSGFVLGRDRVSIRDQISTHCQLYCTAGAASDSGHKNDPPVTTANEAYGVHSLPVSLSSAAPVYERVDTECVK